MTQVTLEDIWEQYRSALKAFLRSRLSNPEDVEDLLQEILIKTFQRRGQVKDQASLKSWLFQVANNTIIDFYRKAATRNDVTAAQDWHTQQGEMVEQDLAVCVRPFIASLPEETAQLLTRIDLEGVSQRDLAVQMGVSYSTLKSRVQKGRSQMRKLFEDCCKMTLDTKGRVAEYQEKTGGCKNC
ncbi:ECF RNA polymerase sigma factor SigR [Pseudovibrio axinellae]|uniref:RNA polymerase sigma factor SigZ n=1 Tax=Pseudovibrio axinellae TaxID=989403 RepID=A0A165Z169_9HYPH|nr:RNA polymerase sigma factor SigZ [Pseudovibrio axinellae]KZL19421.1 ECF RNA polymerase sigma factor SigR [Pseudovibrio axinellae]SER59412.1 RNA polymerase, sigma subunit, SigZ [Pseudovibrio axinellae]